MVQVGYKPSEEEMLRCRRETSGSMALDFMYDKNKFLIVDVGGQTHERKEWNAHYEDSLAVICLVALPGEYT